VTALARGKREGDGVGTPLGHYVGDQPAASALTWVIAAARSAPMPSQSRRNVASSRPGAADTNAPVS
jgi:hypothetical protein